MTQDMDRPVDRARTFLRDEDGGPTVETTLWLAFLFCVLVLVTNASFILFGRQAAFRAIEQANRLYAIGALPDAAATELAVATALQPMSPSVEVRTVLDSQGVVTTAVRMPFSELVATGAFGLLTSGTVTATGQHFMDY